MTAVKMEARSVRYGDLRRCKTAFIDAYPTGSDQKENFSIIGGYVRHYLDMMAMGGDKLVKMIGEDGIICDKPSVLMPMGGHWRVEWAAAAGKSSGAATLASGDTMSVPENLAHSAVPSMMGEASLYHVVATGDLAGLTWTGSQHDAGI